jgi:hypothetical protein
MAPTSAWPPRPTAAPAASRRWRAAKTWRWSTRSRAGARIAWSAGPRVTTSARTDARARGGFGDTILAMVASLAAGPPDRLSPL